MMISEEEFLVQTKKRYQAIAKLSSIKSYLDLILLIRKDQDGKVKFSLLNMHNDHIKELAENKDNEYLSSKYLKKVKIK